MPITVRSGPAKILDTGMATAFMGHDLVLYIEEPVELHIEFGFETREEVEDVAVKVATFGNRMRFDCINFDKADGRGSAQPVLLGEVDDIVVFLHFRVFRYGRTDDRTVHWTLYVADKGDIGWTPIED